MKIRFFLFLFTDHIYTVFTLSQVVNRTNKLKFENITNEKETEPSVRDRNVDTNTRTLGIPVTPHRPRVSFPLMFYSCLSSSSS
jgi:hypothetical protein